MRPAHQRLDRRSPGRWRGRPVAGSAAPVACCSIARRSSCSSVLRAHRTRFTCGSNRRQRALAAPRGLQGQLGRPHQMLRSCAPWSGNNAAPRGRGGVTSQPAMQNGPAERLDHRPGRCAPAQHSTPAARHEHGEPIATDPGDRRRPSGTGSVRRRAIWRRTSSPKLKPCRPLTSRSRSMSITRSSSSALPRPRRRAPTGGDLQLPAVSRPVSPSRSGPGAAARSAGRRARSPRRRPGRCRPASAAANAPERAMAGRSCVAASCSGQSPRPGSPAHDQQERRV